MKKVYLLYVLIAIASIVMALVPNWSNDYLVEMVYRPFEVFGDFLRKILLNGNTFLNVLGTGIYILFCLIPLSVPIVLCVKKKWHSKYLIWVIVSIFLFIMMYFYINPHEMNYVGKPVLDTIFISKAGFAVTLYALIVLGILLILDNKLENKVIYYAKGLIEIITIGLLIKYLFVDLVALKNTIKELDDSFNNGYNIIIYLISVAPSIVILLLLQKAKSFLCKLENDFFDTKNAEEIKKVIFLGKLAILVTFIVTVLINVLHLIFASKLLSMYFEMYLPLDLILITCLVIIFSNILLKGTEINEENKLVI